MAPPVVTVTPTSLTLAPGQAATFVVDAHDPDAATGSATVTVTDSEGNSVPVTVSLEINDPLTFGDAIVEGDAQVTVSKLSETANSATYRVQA